MRAGRSTSGTSYSYVYNGSQLTQMTVGGNTLQFRYSATGAPMAVICNDTYYYYITNIQGDVIGIVDTLGNTVVTYAYDAWGNILGGVDNTTVDLADLNPLRYRGYVYDQETGLYYLQSRYYNPELGRFINADAYVSTGSGIIGYNLFAYANNNPCMFIDCSGEGPELWQWVTSGALFVIGTVLVATGIASVAGGTMVCASVNSIVSSYVNEMMGGSANAGWWGGLITGAVSGFGAGLAGNAIYAAVDLPGLKIIGTLAKGFSYAFGLGTVGSLLGQSASSIIDGKEFDWNKAAIPAVANGTITMLSGIGSGISNVMYYFPTLEGVTTSQALAGALSGGITIVWEVVCDLVGYIASMIG